MIKLLKIRNTNTTIIKNKRKVNKEKKRKYNKSKIVINNRYKMLEAKKINSIWFAYKSEISTSFKDYYDPIINIELNEEELIKRKACLNQFVQCYTFILHYFLDTTYFKHYQCGIIVRCLQSNYFLQYFSLHNYKFEIRKQILKYENQFKTINCYTFIFNKFEDIPLFKCNSEKAVKSFKAKLSITYCENNKEEIITREYLFRVYFKQLVFICNLEILLVTIDFKFAKEYKENNEWILV